MLVRVNNPLKVFYMDCGQWGSLVCVADNELESLPKRSIWDFYYISIGRKSETFEAW